MELNEDFIVAILQEAKRGVLKSKLRDISYRFLENQKDLGVHIKEAKKRGLYSVKMPHIINDTYYQFG